MYQNTFGGISTEKKKDWRDIFEEEYNDDGQLNLVQKGSPYIHEEEGFYFKFHLAVEAIDLFHLTGDANQKYIAFSLLLIPETEYWHENTMKELSDLTDIPADELKNCVTVSDAVSIGAAVRLIREEVKYEDETNPDENNWDDGYYDILDCPQAVEKLNSIASIADTAVNFRGFLLDREWNRIGSNGWDIIEMAVKGKYLFENALSRMAQITAKGA